MKYLVTENEKQKSAILKKWLNALMLKELSTIKSHGHEKNWLKAIDLTLSRYINVSRVYESHSHENFGQKKHLSLRATCDTTVFGKNAHSLDLGHKEKGNMHKWRIALNQGKLRF